MTNSEKIIFLTEAIRAILKREPEIPIEPSVILTDLGLDSLDIVELQMYYEEKTGDIIEPESIITTVSDLMAKMK